jgi:DNA-binding NtrC family response regulator
MAEAAVLLVDDDASIRRMLERTLSAEGYDVTAVADGGAALAGVERSMPDLIVLDEQGAVGFRQAAFNISAMASWRDAALDAEYVAWARETAATVEPWSVGGGYLNYMQADEPVERVRAAFGDQAFGRLQALKRRHDPNNVLRRNQNIPPH